MIRHPTLKAYLLILKADRNCRKAKQIKKEPRKTAKNGSMGGFSIERPVPITKKYWIAAMVSHMPLAKNVMARGLSDLFFIGQNIGSFQNIGFHFKIHNKHSYTVKAEKVKDDDSVISGEESRFSEVE